MLSEGGDNGSRDPLARLKMAMEYEEKKVGTRDHPCDRRAEVFILREVWTRVVATAAGSRCLSTAAVAAACSLPSQRD